MKVRVGWATEYGRFRHDVEYDDGDLELLLQGSGIPADALTPGEKFGIMDAEAQRFSVFSQLEALEDTPDNARQRMEQWASVLSQRLARVKERLGV